jgi:hypothetical protein
MARQPHPGRRQRAGNARQEGQQGREARNAQNQRESQQPGRRGGRAHPTHPVPQVSRLSAKRKGRNFFQPRKQVALKPLALRCEAVKMLRSWGVWGGLAFGG